MGYIYSIEKIQPMKIQISKEAQWNTLQLIQLLLNTLKNDYACPHHKHANIFYMENLNVHNPLITMDCSYLKWMCFCVKAEEAAISSLKRVLDALDTHLASNTLLRATYT